VVVVEVVLIVACGGLGLAWRAYDRPASMHFCAYGGLIVTIDGYEYMPEDQGAPGRDGCDEGSVLGYANAIGYDCKARRPSGRVIMTLRPNRADGTCGQADPGGRQLGDGFGQGNSMGVDGKPVGNRPRPPWRVNVPVPATGLNARLLRTFRSRPHPGVCRPLGIAPHPWYVVRDTDGFLRQTKHADGHPIDRFDLMRPFQDVRVFRDDTMTGVRVSGTHRTLYLFMRTDDPGAWCTYAFRLVPRADLDRMLGMIRYINHG
jgi:hypothetical protein